MKPFITILFFYTLPFFIIISCNENSNQTNKKDKITEIQKTRLDTSNYYVEIPTGFLMYQDTTFKYNLRFNIVPENRTDSSFLEIDILSEDQKDGQWCIISPPKYIDSIKEHFMGISQTWYISNENFSNDSDTSFYSSISLRKDVKLFIQSNKKETLKQFTKIASTLEIR